MSIQVTTDSENIFNAEAIVGTWNGWAVPLFTLDEARRIAAWYNAEADPEYQIVELEQDGDIVFRDGEDGELISASGSDALYSIGGFSWAWYLPTDEEDDE